ncbi:esterase family protein [Nocardia terpenica]|nr:alpha/beta hydrolase family protein [Nocardia terpenica]MBF6065034.1 esterase family protein [Nocardia terpenica]MBF6108091.1 esterase family protein [Nocardia terpenica]MBF6115306.1 esterase family protein [Nocardia terpenica]MBF6122628.1 esterase family protein [Nocardia terpenica]NQE88674.1 esterase family protein [Nocardia terpenica]
MVRRRMRRRLSGAFAWAALLLSAVLLVPPDAVAGPTPPANSGSADGPQPQADRSPPKVASIVRVEPITDRRLRVFVNSPAMGRTVQVQVLLPADTAHPRPTLYMLDGRSASNDGNNWVDRGNAVRFFADKNVNVVLTVGGPAGYYTDWQRPDPVLGNNKWESFLTRELPPLIDERFDGDGRNALEGVSMGAEAAMMLVMRNPTVYRGVAAHSGCYAMGSDFGQAQARAVVRTYGGDPDNMFGDQGDPDWLAHDVMTHAEALRGKAIYLSAASGLPGPYDVAGSETVVFGGPLEAGADGCTMALADRLSRMKIPATVRLSPVGTHSWPYWADELPRAWPTLATALGVSR